MVQVNEHGKVRCEICGQYFNRVACHVNKAHGMNAAQYRAFMNYTKNECLSSEKSLNITRKQSAERYRKGRMQSFIENSQNTKFKAGQSGRKLYERI